MIMWQHRKNGRVRMKVAFLRRKMMRDFMTLQILGVISDKFVKTMEI